MLNSFRSFSGSITTKILLILLIASFAMWGVGDMLSGSNRSHTLAKVGGHNITVDSYRKALAEESERVRRQLGANYSEELLKRLNVPQFVLRRMVQEALLRQEAERMGFIPDDTTVALEIRKMPVFLNQSGVFDKARFENALRTQGATEKTYVENLRMQLATDKLLDTLSIDFPIDEAMLKNLQSAYNQGRTVTLYKLSAATLPAAPAPAEEALVAFHRDHAEQFTAPQYRTVSFARFTANDDKDVAKPISEDALLSYYNTHEDQFRTTEKRDVEQLLYGTEEKAREAYALVKLGKKFSEIADSTSPLNHKSLALGLVDKKSLPESAADHVFRLKAGGFTEPLKSPFGWHIFRVATIEPEGLQPLEKVRGTIEAQLKQEAHESALTDKMNQMEDALASGSTLKEASASMGIHIEDAGTFDKDGNTPQGTPNKAIPELDKFLDIAFKTEEKTESSVVTSKNGVYYILRVESITPEKLRPFASVKSEVAKAYAQFQANKQIAELASAIDEELSKGKAAKDIVSAHKLSVAATGAVHRDSKSLGEQFLLPSFTAQIFSSDIGALTNPSRDKDGDFMLAHISGTAPARAPASEADLKLRKKETTQAMQEEMMMQYLRYLETQYPVDIRQDMFSQLTQDTGDAPR